MKVQVKNLGALRQAEFSLGDLTILCGGNNTGKTYATYALFGFLTTWREGLRIKVPEQTIDQLLAEGTVLIDVNDYVEKAPEILSAQCGVYSRQLPKIFAAPAARFADSKFEVTLDVAEVQLAGEYERRLGTANIDIFSFSKTAGGDLAVTLLIDKEKVKIHREFIALMIGGVLKDIIFGHLFPNPFIASAERTGAAIFRKELNFARNRLLDEMTKTNKNLDPMDLFFKVYQDYALPVESNVEFTRQLETNAKNTSFISENHPNVIDDFADIIGGEYTVTRNDELYFLPKGKRIKLTMDESSSAVRSLLDIGFYLKHMAKPGDLLMVDEPELNLHPENQRRVARLFARLVNLGIKVFITTHSDYIIKELNTLIMLNQDKPHLKDIAEREKYKKEELIGGHRIKVYIAEEAMVKLDGGQRKTRCQTLTEAKIDPVLGIEARSFDVTIDAMNRIQEEIIWGGD